MTTTGYHHGNLREALVAAAVEAAREHGTEGLSLRELARRVGVSHNAAYRHFADRDALVAEVALAGLAGLVATMDRGMQGVAVHEPVARARARLAQCGRAYVSFAVAEPGLFKVVFTAYPSLPSADERSGAPDPYARLNRALDDLVDVGFLGPEARVGADLSCWAAVHGFAVLCTEGPMRELPEPERTAALDTMLVAIDRGYGATTGAGWPPLELGRGNGVDAVVNDR